MDATTLTDATAAVKCLQVWAGRVLLGYPRCYHNNNPPGNPVDLINAYQFLTEYVHAAVQALIYVMRCKGNKKNRRGEA